MPLTLTWHEIALRLALSVIAGSLVGLDRGEHGRPAGLRTTLLVCLAAAVAMIQTNLLLATAGKASDSFVVLDLMRLPLGILTGMGFIGGGAILKKDGLVQGVTTAATLWFVTVIGLCFGGGQILLGVAALGLCIFVLSGLRWFDHHMKQEKHGTLTLTTERNQPGEEQIQDTVRKHGYKIGLSSIAQSHQAEQRNLEFHLQWREDPDHVKVPPFLKDFSNDPQVMRVEWKVI